MEPFEYLKELISKAKNVEINPDGSAYIKDVEGEGHYLEASFVNERPYDSPLSTAAKILGIKNYRKKLGFGCD